MNNTQFPLKKIIVPLVLIAAVIVSLLIVRSMQFRLVSTDPSTSAVSNISPFIKINFSKTLDAKGVTITPDNMLIDSYSVDNKTITVNLKAMYIGKTYTINLGQVRSQEGKVLSNLSVRFTAKDISFKELSKDQQQAILKRQDAAPKASNDPIFQYVPYSTLSYTINAYVGATSQTNPSGVYLKADILISNAELSGDLQGTINQYEQAVRDYIQSKGLDPAAYVIDYNVVTPTGLESD
jgi:hypothetical protein